MQKFTFGSYEIRIHFQYDPVTLFRLGEDVPGNHLHKGELLFFPVVDEQNPEKTQNLVPLSRVSNSRRTICTIEILQSTTKTELNPYGVPLGKFLGVSTCDSRDRFQKRIGRVKAFGKAMKKLRVEWSKTYEYLRSLCGKDGLPTDNLKGLPIENEQAFVSKKAEPDDLARLNSLVNQNQ